MPSRVIRVPVTVISSTPAGRGVTSWPPAMPAHSAQAMAADSFVGNGPSMIVM
jgi:hypothetical protein